MDWVYNELKRYEIKPNFLKEESEESDYNNQSELLDRIKIKAEHLRRVWNGNGEYEEFNIKNKNKVKAKADDLEIVKDDLSVEKSKDNFKINKEANVDMNTNPGDKVAKPLFDFRN